MKHTRQNGIGLFVTTIVALIVMGCQPAEDHNESAVHPEALTANVESEVLVRANEMWGAARQVNEEQMLGSAIPSDDGFYVMGGNVWWTYDETVANFAAMFDGVERQNLEMSKELVTALSPALALYVGTGTYEGFGADGASFGGGRFSISMVFELRDGSWEMVHAHQSFPLD